MRIAHLNTCPDCGTFDSGHLMDPPPHCPHDYERFEPAQYVALDDLTEWLKARAEALGDGEAEMVVHEFAEAVALRQEQTP